MAKTSAVPMKAWTPETLSRASALECLSVLVLSKMKRDATRPKTPPNVWMLKDPPES